MSASVNISDMSNSEAIEGEWNNFTISLATSDDFGEISTMLKNNFYRDEPLNELLNWSEERDGDHDLMLRAVLSHGISLKAIEKNTNKIVGVRLTSDSRKYFKLEDLNVQSEQTQKVINIKNKLDSEADITRRLHVKFLAEFLMSSVDQEYRNIGLATELYTRNVALLKYKGFPLVKCCFTSAIARKIGIKLGFEELSRIYLFDECDEDGESLFPNANPNQYVSIMILKLT